MKTLAAIQRGRLSWQSITKNMKAIKLMAAGAVLLASLASNTAPAQWLSADVGTPTYPGSSVVTGSTNIISGGGADIWNNSDQCFYYYQPVTGVWWDAVMRVQDLQGPDWWTKAMLMVRFPDPLVGTPQGGDLHISASTTRAAGENWLFGAYRNSRDGGSGDFRPEVRPAYPNCWLRVERFGATFNLYLGTNGVNWTKYRTYNTSTTADGFSGTPWPNPILVGVAVTAHNDGSSALGVATISDLSVTVNPVTPPSTLTVTKQVQSTSAYVGTEASFSFAVSDNAIPQGIYFPSYQWYKNNQLVTNATGPNFTFLAWDGDNGAQVYCQASYPAFPAVVPVNSATGTVTTIAGSLMYTNGLKLERFYGATRVGVEAGNTGPVQPSRITALDLTGGYGGDYSQRISGWFKAPTSGNYTFYVASDDDADVFLSTDSNPANKRLIVQQYDWSGYRKYTTGGNVEQKCSDTWQADVALPVSPAPYASGIPLVADNLYYFETVMHQGGGGDNLSVTYRMFENTTEIVDDLPSKLDVANGNLVFMTSPTTTLVWTAQPTNTTVFEGQNVTFRSLASSDSELALGYQWYRNNAPIGNATGPNFSLATAAVDNGAQFFVTAKTADGLLSLTSSPPVTLTVLQAVFEPGYVKVEFWQGATRQTIEAGTAGDPTYVTTSPAFEAGINNASGDNFGRRLSGVIVPATSGLYDFFVNSDDTSDLFVGTSVSPGTKRLVAQETVWSDPRKWLSTGGGSILSQKRSDTWSTVAGETAPYELGIQLTAGTKYYVEAVETEGTGGDNVSVTMKLHTDADPIDDSPSVLTGSLIGLNAIRCGYMAFTQQPQSVTVESLAPATFTAAGVTDSTLSLGVIGDPRPLVANPVYVLYQWFKNGVAIPGATTTTLTIPQVVAADNNAQITCQIRALGYADASLNRIWSNSTPATLTVNLVPATFRYAGYVVNTNQNPTAGVGYVTLSFDKPMSLSTLQNAANYTLGGGLTKTGVIIVNTYNSNNRVALEVTGTWSASATVTATGLLDGAGLAVSVPTTPVGAIPFTTSDVGIPGVDPIFPSMLFVDGPKDYTIVAQGSDFWANADGGNLTWELKTGNFDVVTRVKSISFTSTWAKGGLMARDTLYAGSRNWNIVCTPTPGANGIEANSRPALDGASGGFDGTRPQPKFPNAWVRLARNGNVITAYYSTNGVNWTLTGTQDATAVGDLAPLPPTMYVGLCNTAHENDVVGVEPYLDWNQVEFADYSSSFVATVPVTLSVVKAGNNLNISWTPNAGQLYSSPVVGSAAVWTLVPAASNPAVIPIAAGQSFFQVK